MHVFCRVTLTEDYPRCFVEIFNWHIPLVSKNKSFSIIQYVGKWHPKFATDRADRCIYWDLVPFSTIRWTESNILEILNIVLFSVKLRAIVLYKFKRFFLGLLSHSILRGYDTVQDHSGSEGKVHSKLWSILHINKRSEYCKLHV